MKLILSQQRELRSSLVKFWVGSEILGLERNFGLGAKFWVGGKIFGLGSKFRVEVGNFVLGV